MASTTLNNEFKQFRIAYDDYLDERYVAKSMQGGSGGGTTQTATSLQAGLMSAEAEPPHD